MFNSPPVCKQWRALDEECGRRHAKAICPLSAVRSGIAALRLQLDSASLASPKHVSSNKLM